MYCQKSSSYNRFVVYPSWPRYDMEITGKYDFFNRPIVVIYNIMNYPAAELRGIKTFKDRKA
jgi:hypothetical protein